MSENEYKELVMAAFDRASKGRILSQELLTPTAGNIKAEAVKVCSRRFNPKDEMVLGSFVKAEPGAAAYHRAIQNCDYQLFKPLNTFLNDRSKGTAFKNIQLLAWLIDFKPRPFHPELQIRSIAEQEPASIPSIPIHDGNEKDLTENTVVISGHGPNTRAETEAEETDTQKPFTDEGNMPHAEATKPNRISANRWLIGTACLIAGGLLIWRSLADRNNCMYWANDHYIATSCNIPRSDTPLVQLDPEKLGKFRRIHQVDTLTYNSVDKLWYVRVAGIIEVYSAQGKHPLYPDKRLAPLTYYAVNVCKKQHGY